MGWGRPLNAWFEGMDGMAVGGASCVCVMGFLCLTFGFLGCVGIALGCVGIVSTVCSSIRRDDEGVIVAFLELSCNSDSLTSFNLIIGGRTLEAIEPLTFDAAGCVPVDDDEAISAETGNKGCRSRTLSFALPRSADFLWHNVPLSL